MKKAFGTIAAVAVLAAIGGAPPASAAAEECGDVRSVKDVTADGTSCAQAKKVAKVWDRLCSYAGRCVVDLNAAQYTCRGRGGNPVTITCKKTDSDAKVRFKARL